MSLGVSLELALQAHEAPLTARFVRLVIMVASFYAELAEMKRQRMNAETR